MKSILSKLSVTRRLGVIVFLFAVTTILIATDIILTLEKNKIDSTIMNVATRQRTLTTKYASEIMLSVYEGHRSVHATLDYNNTGKLYELSLNALKNGGETFEDISMSKSLELPSNQAQLFINQVSKTEQLWDRQKSMANALINSTSKPTEAQVDQFMLANQETLNSMNDAVLIYNQYAGENIQVLKQDIIYISLIGVTICILVTAVIGRTITNPIHKLVDVSLATSKGDLEERSEINMLVNNSELGILAKNVQSMRHALSSVVKGLKTSAVNITNLSSRVETLSHEVNSSYQDEKSKYEEISAISDELVATFDKVSFTVTQTLESASQSQQSASKGLNSVSENIRTVELASIESEKVSANVQELSTVAEHVYSIIDVIQTIAEQTNLLALNAAIEAARAGEQGRGFAVVADEVRVLAQKTNHSTVEISNLLNQLTERVKISVDSVEQLQVEVQNSKRCSHETEQSIELITSSIELTVGQQNEIASLIEQQSMSINELKKAQDYLTNLLENTNKKITSSSQIAVDMSDMAKGISSTLNEFTLATK